MRYSGNSMNSIYKDVCRDVMINGQTVMARGLMTHEVLNAQIELYLPIHRFVSLKGRDINMRYCIGELCHYLDGRTDLKSIAHYSKFWEKVSDDGETINSCYGNRLFKYRHKGEYDTQFHYAIETLRRDKSSRKAVMMIYEREDARPSRDNPCTIFLQLIIRDDELYLFTHMRSEDVWLGVPYDFVFFTIVQEIAYVKLLKDYPTLTLGSYIHSVTSLHLYDYNFNAARRLAVDLDSIDFTAPQITSRDIDSWFDDLLTYEKSKRGVVTYKNENTRTLFQDWCKAYIK
jgi:thymidylate synthase